MCHLYVIRQDKNANTERNRIKQNQENNWDGRINQIWCISFFIYQKNILSDQMAIS